MPFTASHAIVALPFVRTPLVPSAIAIGAMTPDLPMFLRGIGLGYVFTHSAVNVVWTALIALALFLVWRVVLRPAVGELAPRWVAERLPDDWSTRGVRAATAAVGVGLNRPFYPLLLAVSLIIGVLSHIVWDLFTHEGRLGVELFPALDAMWGPVPGVKWLQHGSSVLGLLGLGIWALLRLRRAEPRPDRARRLPHVVRFVWWLSLPVTLIGAWIIGLMAFGPITAEFTLQHLAYRVLPSTCGIWGLATAILCVVIAVMRRPAQRGVGHTG